MAIATVQNQINSASTDLWANKPKDIWSRSYVMLWKIWNKGKFQDTLIQPGDLTDGGVKVREPLIHLEANSGGYGNTTIMLTDKKTILTSARFERGGIYAGDTIDLEIRETNTSGPTQMVKIIDTKLDNIAKTARKVLATDFYSGYSSDPGDEDRIYGVDLMFEKAGPAMQTTWGNLATADIGDGSTTWRPGYHDTSSQIGFPTMQAIRRAASVGQTSEHRPDIYTMQEVVYDAYEAGLQTQQRFTGDQEMADAGFENLRFKEGVVVADDLCPASSAGGDNYAVFGFNTRHLFLRTIPEYAFTDPVWKVLDETQPDKLYAQTRWRGSLTTNHWASHVYARQITV